MSRMSMWWDLGPPPTGYTVVDYDRLLEKQGQKCALCEKARSKEVVLYIDEVQGQVRGLICQGCIATLRLVKEDVVLLNKFIVYVTPKLVTSDDIPT